MNYKQTFPKLFTDENISYEGTQDGYSTTSICTIKLVSNDKTHYEVPGTSGTRGRRKTCKLISCSNHTTSFDVKYVGFFWHQNIFSKLPYEPESHSDEFPSQNFRNSCKPKTSCKIIIVLMLTELRIKSIEI
jgi:hypothetical protein